MALDVSPINHFLFLAQNINILWIPALKFSLSLSLGLTFSLLPILSTFQFFSHSILVGGLMGKQPSAKKRKRETMKAFSICW